MFQKLFVTHPASIDESYAEHFGIALRFGATMVAGGLGCIVHAFIPGVFVKTASDTTRSLNEELQARRNLFLKNRPASDYAIEYHI